MLRSEELAKDISNMKADMKVLQDEGKIEDAYNMISDLENLKRERALALETEAEEEKEIENIKIEDKKGEDVKMENKNVLSNEEVAFLNYVKTGRIDNAYLTAGGNGALIPTTISAKIIEKVAELSPVYSKCTVFNLGGKLTFAKENAGATVTYASSENAEASEQVPSFTTITLDSYVANCLVVISKSLINNAAFDVLSYVIDEIAKGMANFFEKEILKGDGSSHCTGAINTTNAKTASGSIKIDDLIDTQLAVPSRLQDSCVWVMNTDTLAVIRKLENQNKDKYLLPSAVEGYTYQLLGKPVYLTSALGANEVIYGDFSYMYVKFAQSVDTQVLYEKYATKHSVGVLADCEVDCKIANDQAIAKLTIGE